MAHVAPCLTLTGRPRTDEADS